MGGLLLLVGATAFALVKFVHRSPQLEASVTGAITLPPVSAERAEDNTDAVPPRSAPVATATAQPEPIGRPVTITPPVLPVVDEVRLEIEADAACWLQVMADDKLLYQGTLQAGESRAWRADEALKVSFGRAGVVRLKLNGVSLGAAGAGSLTRTFSRRVAAEALAYARSH